MFCQLVLSASKVISHIFRLFSCYWHLSRPSCSGFCNKISLADPPNSLNWIESRTLRAFWEGGKAGATRNLMSRQGTRICESSAPYSKNPEAHKNLCHLLGFSGFISLWAKFDFDPARNLIYNMQSNLMMHSEANL